jgi:hypothetical protein
MKTHVSLKWKTAGLLVVLLTGFLMLNGCAGSFGSLSPDDDVIAAFRSGQSSPEYTYYFRKIPYQGNAIAGLRPRYAMDDLWQTVDLSQTSLDQLVAKLSSSASGAQILNQEKQPIGVLYSKMKLLVRIKDNQRVSIYSPKPVRMGGGK